MGLDGVEKRQIRVWVFLQPILHLTTRHERQSDLDLLPHIWKSKRKLHFQKENLSKYEKARQNTAIAVVNITIMIKKLKPQTLWLK